MADLHNEIDINDDQAEAMALGLYAVAKADGHVHPREAALIADFYMAAHDNPSDLGALERAATVDGTYLAAKLPTKDMRQLFVKTAMLLAYTDGSYGVQESRLISEFSKELELSEQDLRQLETQVKEYMLSQLTHLKNMDAISKVAKELKV
jgi:tellurite resistance protein